MFRSLMKWTVQVHQTKSLSSCMRMLRGWRTSRKSWWRVSSKSGILRLIDHIINQEIINQDLYLYLTWIDHTKANILDMSANMMMKNSFLWSLILTKHQVNWTSSLTWNQQKWWVEIIRALSYQNNHPQQSLTYQFSL